MGSGASRQRQARKNLKGLNRPIVATQPYQDDYQPMMTPTEETSTPIADDSDEEVLQVQHIPSTLTRTSASEVNNPLTDTDTALPERDDARTLLARYSNHIFERADLDQDSFLNQSEFCNLAFSRTLDLRISEEDALAMLAAYGNEQGHVSQADFYEVMLHLIQLYSQARAQELESGWQWFGMYFDDDPNALPAYYNTATAELTYEKPDDYVNTRVVETQSFEDLELSDGTVSFFGLVRIPDVGLISWGG
jgi:hypothetical protein